MAVIRAGGLHDFVGSDIDIGAQVASILDAKIVQSQIGRGFCIRVSHVIKVDIKVIGRYYAFIWVTLIHAWRITDQLIVVILVSQGNIVSTIRIDEEWIDVNRCEAASFLNTVAVIGIESLNIAILGAPIAVEEYLLQLPFRLQRRRIFVVLSKVSTENSIDDRRVGSNPHAAARGVSRQPLLQLRLVQVVLCAIVNEGAIDHIKATSDATSILFIKSE